MMRYREVFFLIFHVFLEPNSTFGTNHTLVGTSGTGIVATVKLRC